MFAFIITFVCYIAIVKHKQFFFPWVDASCFWLMCVCVCVRAHTEKENRNETVNFYEINFSEKYFSIFSSFFSLSLSLRFLTAI